MVVRPIPSVVLCSVLALLGACGGEEHPSTAPRGGSRPVVWATSWPVWSWAKRIGGDAIDLRCVLPADADVESFEPERKTIAAIADAELVVSNGAELEHWTMHASLPLGIVVDASRAFAKELLTLPTADAHAHGPGETHVHGGLNPHVWLDPVFAQQQARAVHEGLSRVLPAAQVQLDQGLQILITEFEGLDAQCRAIRFAPGELLVATHPTWAYLGKRYGWPIADAHAHANDGIDDAELASIVAAAADKRVRAVLVEDGTPEAGSKRILDALHAPVVVFDPDLGRGAGDLSRDTVLVLRAGVTALAEAMR